MRAFDLPCLEQEGFEADDLIATYARLASERGATTTIVSSDKDLMQLVTDKVVMYDTMKDRRIGIAEVIEKFGVPPEKVVEVQALIGDSTDNVPGVPGIGIKTAAQLIVEYGDLEQLLLRAPEIKQPKRRQALIENAEKARISRQLVLLDDKVELDVPLDDLAVHDPDARKLIAFLKAMEFTTLTRRVAEYSQIDPADVAADAGKTGGAVAAPPFEAKSGGDIPATCSPATRRCRLPRSPVTGRTSPQASRARRSRSPRPRRGRSRRSRSIGKVPDHPQPRSRSRPGSRAPRCRPCRDRCHVGFARSDAGRDSGIALALAPNDAGYVPLGHKHPAAARACSMRASRRTRSRRPMRWPH